MTNETSVPALRTDEEWREAFAGKLAELNARDLDDESYHREFMRIESKHVREWMDSFSPSAKACVAFYESKTVDGQGNPILHHVPPWVSCLRRCEACAEGPARAGNRSPNG